MAELMGTATELKSYRTLKLLAVSFKVGLLLRRKVVESEQDLWNLSPLSQGMVLSFTNSVVQQQQQQQQQYLGGSTAAMMTALASMSTTLLGRTELESAHIDSWIQYGIHAIEIPLESSSSSIDVKDDLTQALSILNQHLSSSTTTTTSTNNNNNNNDNNNDNHKKDDNDGCYYMVGDSITIADISLCCALYQASIQNLWNSSLEDNDDETLVIIRQWYNHITHQSFFLKALHAFASSSNDDEILTDNNNNNVISTSTK